LPAAVFLFKTKHHIFGERNDRVIIKGLPSNPQRKKKSPHKLAAGILFVPPKKEDF